jgi:hypothetical protein
LFVLARPLVHMDNVRCRWMPIGWADAVVARGVLAV